MRVLFFIVLVAAAVGCEHPANTSQRLPPLPPDFYAYLTSTNLANQIMGTDLIIVTNVNLSEVCLTISGKRAREIVQAVSSGRRYKYELDPGVLWDRELQFYKATNHLASVLFEGDAFSGDGGEIYEDETGVLDKLYRETYEQATQAEMR